MSDDKREAAIEAALDEYLGYDPDVPMPADMLEGFRIGAGAGWDARQSEVDALEAAVLAWRQIGAALLGVFSCPYCGRIGSECTDDGCALRRLYEDGSAEAEAITRRYRLEGARELSAEEWEIRRNQDGSLDEVVGRGFFHLEQMSGTHWWMALYSERDDCRISIDLTTARATIHGEAERQPQHCDLDHSPIPCVTCGHIASEHAGKFRDCLIAGCECDGYTIEAGD